MSTLRFKCIEQAYSHKPVRLGNCDTRPEKIYGMFVFDRRKMFEYLPGKTFAELVSAIDNKTPLSRETADVVADGMKRWAIDCGARHYTHWFHPLTGGTAEKHDAFIEHDGKGGVIERFSGKMLVQQEPDASSFPNGGIRNTFEARGYSAWDISSPAFILDGTLCIPTVFISYTGESLDYKTPLLRALNSIDRAATRVARYFDPEVSHVTSFLGWEQEYFLIDEAIFAARPDLVLTGRTLMGHESARTSSSRTIISGLYRRVWRRSCLTWKWSATSWAYQPRRAITRSLPTSLSLRRYLRRPTWPMTITCCLCR